MRACVRACLLACVRACLRGRMRVCITSFLLRCLSKLAPFERNPLKEKCSFIDFSLQLHKI